MGNLVSGPLKSTVNLLFLVVNAFCLYLLLRSSVWLWYAKFCCVLSSVNFLFILKICWISSLELFCPWAVFHLFWSIFDHELSIQLCFFLTPVAPAPGTLDFPFLSLCTCCIWVICGTCLQHTDVSFSCIWSLSLVHPVSNYHSCQFQFCSLLFIVSLLNLLLNFKCIKKRNVNMQSLELSKFQKSLDNNLELFGPRNTLICSLIVPCYSILNNRMTCVVLINGVTTSVTLKVGLLKLDTMHRVKCCYGWTAEGASWFAMLHKG